MGCTPICEVKDSDGSDSENNDFPIGKSLSNGRNQERLGISKNLPLIERGNLGSLSASEIISYKGARPNIKLKTLL